MPVSQAYTSGKKNGAAATSSVVLPAGASNDFKWKAFSERDGNLVILTPASLTGRAARVDVVDDGRVLASSSNISAMSANGGRTHFRFDSPGTAWGMGSKWVFAYDKSGNKIGEFPVSDPSSGGLPAFGAAGMFGELASVEPLGEIDVNALLDEMGAINRKATETNFGIAQTMGRKVADNAFTDFTAFLDKILPEAGTLTRSVAREAQNFIERGLPSAVMGNAILRDSAMFAATGTRGGVAVRRGLANEAARDTQAVQYGMGVAQQLVNDARSTALPFAQLGAEATMNNLGLLTQLTTITPAQRIGMAFDERNYQTGVAQFNAGAANQMSMFNAGQANSMAQFNAQMDFQTMQFQTEMAMQQELQREQQRAAQKAQQAALWSTLGTVGGAAAGFAIGGPMGAMMGAQIGGGLGQAAAGQQTGNYALVSQGLQTGMGAYGTYNSWQGQQAQLGMQQQLLDMNRQQLASQSAFNMTLLNRQGALPSSASAYPFSSTNTGSWLYNSFGVR